MSRARVKIPAASVTPYALDIEDEGLNVVTDPTALNFTGAGVTVTENPAGVAEIDIPDASVKFWTESESAATQQNTRWTPNNVAADVTAVIQPKGNGANTAQRPDGTITGGNARGQFATDWQKNRNNANQVASGNNSTVIGGIQNTASGAQSTALGGSRNIASGSTSCAGGDFSTSSGDISVSLGSSCLASGSKSCTFNANNRAAGSNSFAINQLNEVSGLDSSIRGSGGKNRNSYSSVLSASFLSAGNIAPSSYTGRTQEGVKILGFNSRLTGINPPNLLSSGQIFTLYSGCGSVISANNGAWLPAKDNQHFSWEIKLLATVTAISGTATGVSIGDVKQWNFEGSGKIVAGTRTILNASTTPVILYEDTGISTMSAQFIIGSASESFGVEVTNATFVGGGSLELFVSGFLYWQETSLD